MHIKLDYFYFSTFDLDVKTTKILKYILPFHGEKHDQGRWTNHQIYLENISHENFSAVCHKKVI